jgi:hypothetical protein
LIYNNPQIYYIMKNKHQVHNLIILDESGSMKSVKKTIINGFNELVDSIKLIEKEFPEQEHLISMLSFNSKKINVMHFAEPVKNINAINNSRYNPECSTPLYDAMAFGLLKMKQLLENRENNSVLVTVLTDGEENASKEFTRLSLVKIIEDLKLLNWTFTYIGTDHDVSWVSKSLHIDNSMHFEKNHSGIKSMFENETVSRIKYSLSIREGKTIIDNFYR